MIALLFSVLQSTNFAESGYYYNVGEFNDDYWHIDDMDLIFRQLKSVDIIALQDKGKDYIAAYTALLKFMAEMLDSKTK